MIPRGKADCEARSSPACAEVKAQETARTAHGSGDCSLLADAAADIPAPPMSGLGLAVRGLTLGHRRTVPLPLLLLPKRDARFLRCAPCRDRDLLRGEWPQPHRSLLLRLKRDLRFPQLRPLTGFATCC